MAVDPNRELVAVLDRNKTGGAVLDLRTGRVSDQFVLNLSQIRDQSGDPLPVVPDDVFTTVAILPDGKRLLAITKSGVLAEFAIQPRTAGPGE